MRASHAEAAEYKVCLDFELGEELWDASRATGSGKTPCDDDTDPCPSNELCISSMFFNGCTPEKDETYGRDEGTRPFPAMRTLARVLDEDAFLADEPASVLWGWSMLDDDGCTDVFEADVVINFRLEYFLWSENPTEQNPTDRNFWLGYACSDMPGLGLSSCTHDRQFIESISPNGSTCGNEPCPTVVSRTLGATETDAQQRAHYPFWAVTFAESRVGQPDVWPLAKRRHAYVVVDTLGELSQGTHTDYAFGRQPTVWAKGNGWHYKWAMSHEAGHVLVQQLGLDMQLPHIDYSLSGDGHLIDSFEWSAAAAVEGFVQFYSMVVWHDVEGSGQLPWIGRRVGLALRALQLPRGALCLPTTCGGPGRGNEMDWASALITFYRDTSSPGLGHVLGMNAAAHDDACIGLQEMACETASTCTWSTPSTWAIPYMVSDMCVGWPVNESSTAYADQFDAAMQAYLTQAEYQAWGPIADTYEVNN